MSDLVRTPLVFHDVYAPRAELIHCYRDHPDMSSNKIKVAELTFYSGGEEPMAVTLDETSARTLAAALVAGFAPQVNLGPSHAVAYAADEITCPGGC